MLNVERWLPKIDDVSNIDVPDIKRLSVRHRILHWCIVLQEYIIENNTLG